MIKPYLMTFGLLDWLLDLELSRGNRAAIDGENSAIKRELAEVESASVSPAGKLLGY
jgi:hypothetical protein